MDEIIKTKRHKQIIFLEDLKKLKTCTEVKQIVKQPERNADLSEEIFKIRNSCMNILLTISF